LGTLEKKKLIRSKLAAKYKWWINGFTLKAGYYKLNDEMSLSGILSVLHEGKEHFIKVTIPEGLLSEEIARVLKQSGFSDISDEFLEQVKNPDILAEFNIPFDSAEGYLFPSTYYLNKNTTGTELVRRMIRTFYQKAGERFKNLPLAQRKKVLILASIIEKEAVLDEERALMASVFYNRLRNGIPLESCATVIYIFEKQGKSKQRLLYRDLEIDSPFNTYKKAGLPPEPISNPGLKSILAAMEPAESDYLYFVYKGDGKHVFSRTLREHMQAYRKYILYQNRRKQ
jgi:UPF0755 protein